MVNNFCDTIKLVEENSKKQLVFPIAIKQTKKFFGSVDTKCYYCESELTDINRSKDHVIPRLLGGKLTKKNKVWACRNCNGIKGSSTLNVFKRFLMKMKRPKKGLGKIHVYENRLTIIKNIDVLLKQL